MICVVSDEKGISRRNQRLKATGCAHTQLDLVSGFQYFRMKKGERVCGYVFIPLFSGKDRRLEDYISKLSVRKKKTSSLFLVGTNFYHQLLINIHDKLCCKTFLLCLHELRLSYPAVYPQHANNLSDHISSAYARCQQFQGKERRCQSDKQQALLSFPFLSPTPVSLRIHYYQSDP